MQGLPPLIVGEVLFDHFPDGSTVLGGAPFNVAWNLQGLGLRPVFVSAVGDDDEGLEILRRMRDWGMDCRGVQVSRRFPTGQVQVTVNEGQPSFEILADQAYDDIGAPDLATTPRDCSLLYVGSLAYRDVTTRHTIQQLIDSSGLPRFVDINIRSPWFDPTWLPQLLGGARWVKLNEDELALLSHQTCRTAEEIRSATTELMERFGNSLILVTCGARGAYACDEQGQLTFVEASAPEPMVDAVGAGDAFAAAVIARLLAGHSLQAVLEGAVRFAARACTIQGATIADRSHYRAAEI